MGELTNQLQKMLGRYQYSPAMTEILQSIIEGQWTSLRHKEILAENKVRLNSVAFKEETLDVALQYAKICLEDDAISEEEMKAMYMLKRLLGIEEGDFYKYGKKSDVRGILAAQLYKLYDDGEINYDEALHKVALQGLFNLSYEEFEEIVHEIAQTVQEREADKYNKLEDDVKVDLQRLDPMFAEVARYVVSMQEGSTSRIQRKFEIGYNRAGKLSDQLEAAGIVGPFKGPQGRDVLIQDLDQLDTILQDLGFK